MKKTITYIFMSAVLSILNLNAQNLVDFETPVTATPRFGATFQIVTNTATEGLNKTATCGKIGRTGTNFYELVDVPCDFSIPANEKRYVHMMVLYSTQPDIAPRLNTEGTSIRAMNTYTDLGKWQDLVFEFEGGDAGKVVTQIRVLGDAGVLNDPVGYVLNNTDQFGLIDEIIVNNDANPRAVSTSVKKDLKEKNYSLYVSNKMICFSANDNSVNKVEIYNASGVLVRSFNQNQFSYSVPFSGLYIVKIGNEVDKVMVN